MRDRLREDSECSNHSECGLHTLVYENHLDDRVMWNVDLMCAHAIGAAISRSIITVTELFRWDVLDL